MWQEEDSKHTITLLLLLDYMVELQRDMLETVKKTPEEFRKHLEEKNDPN